MNASLPPSKRSRLEHQMDKIILGMFALLISMCLAGSTCFAIWTKTLSPAMWYLAPDRAPTAFNPEQPQLVGSTTLTAFSYTPKLVLPGPMPDTLPIEPK